jgi:hypothetical protein
MEPSEELIKKFTDLVKKQAQELKVNNNVIQLKTKNRTERFEIPKAVKEPTKKTNQFR